MIARVSHHTRIIDTPTPSVAIVAQADFHQSADFTLTGRLLRIIPYMALASQCSLCNWRKRVLPEFDGGVVCGLCGPAQSLISVVSSPKRQRAMHETPSRLWTDILNTEKLYAPRVEWSPHRNIPWLRFDCRGMRPFIIPRSSHIGFHCDSIDDQDGNYIDADAGGMYTMYKYVRQDYLVSHFPGVPHSRGILVDGGMRNGTDHTDGIGVYAYARKPWECFSVNDGLVMLELRMNCGLTRCKGKNRGKYVLKSDQSEDSIGGECYDCQVTAMYVMWHSAPGFVKI